MFAQELALRPNAVMLEAPADWKVILGPQKANEKGEKLAKNKIEAATR